MPHIEGTIYQESGFINGYLEFEDGEIKKIGRGQYPEHNKSIAKGVILPLFTNSHTHLGDAIAYGRNLDTDLESLVTPPNGLKFKILRESKAEDLMKAMHQSVLEMLNTGTVTFIDFREEGITGIELLNHAVADLPVKKIVMGRPKELTYSKAELSKLLPKVDGVGLSSISDWEYSDLEKVVRTTKQYGKLFALHACERTHEDMDKILELKPDFLVHMTHGRDTDFETLSDLEIPVVLCPRSNLFFKNPPNIPNMLKRGLTLVLGTDNAMLNTPNLFEELKVGFKLANRFGKVAPDTMLKTLTINLKKILNPKDYISLAPGTQSNFIVLEIPQSKPEITIVNGIRPENIKLINIGTTFWKR